MKKCSTLLLVIYITLFNGINAEEQTTSHQYEGKVEGMVCAFCVYNVSKKIAQIPEIDASTVNVDLKSNKLNFSSSTKIGFERLAKQFLDSGFKLTELKEVKKASLKIPTYQSNPIVSFTLDNLDIESYKSIFESIGEVAASTNGKLVIRAPAAVEITILKPMIAGKQKIARVQYQFENNKKNIEINLYLQKK